MNKKKSHIASTIVWIVLYVVFVYVYLKEIVKLEDYSIIEEIESVSLVTVSLLVIVLISERLFPHNQTWNKLDMQTFNNVVFSFLI